MLTAEQQKWIDHLDDVKKVEIFPFDNKAEEKFQAVKKKIQAVLGQEIPVEHHGATSLGISGQDEVDIYVLASASEFNQIVARLESVFGPARSLYPLIRARFPFQLEGKRMDIFVANKEGEDWNNHIKFENYLKSNPDALEEYRKLKEDGNGLSIREYYRRKNEFINKILEKAQ